MSGGPQAPVFLPPGGPLRPFPDPRRVSGGLVAVGGDLSPDRLLQGYRQGIFPWFNPGDPILWWSPDPRGVLLPSGIHVGRSLRKAGRNSFMRLSCDRAFRAVVDGCAGPRRDMGGTWITGAMAEAYQRLFHKGWAHSVEVWDGTELVGGLYGVAVGGVFFGESMFSRAPNASKLALAWLARLLTTWGYQLIDTQFLTAHLASMGAEEWPRNRFLDALDSALVLPGRQGPWAVEARIADVF